MQLLTNFYRCIAIGCMVAGAITCHPLMAQAPAIQPVPPSSTAQRLYVSAKQDLVQIRVLLKNGRSQYTTGSGFLIGADSLAITNYHVISQIALEPESYLGEYVNTDGTKGKLELIAVDVLRDLAVVRLDRKGNDFFKLPKSAATVEQGQNLYSLGNPLDLGFAISEGTYNGISRRGFSEQLMFSGALNPGMSGGPSITGRGTVAGVNVSHRRDGELVSFLVPADYAHTLLEQARAVTTPPTDFKPIIGQQLIEHQQVMIDHLLKESLTPKTLGPYRVPVRESDQLRCWGNSETSPKETYTTNSIYCGMESAIYISGELQTGFLSFSYELIRSKETNAFRFSRLLSKFFGGKIQSNHKGSETTEQMCSQEFINNEHLPMRAVLCFSAYRKFSDLYDVTLLTVTTDDDLMSLKSAYELKGVSYENGLQVAQLFLNSIALAQEELELENNLTEPTTQLNATEPNKTQSNDTQEVTP